MVTNHDILLLSEASLFSLMAILCLQKIKPWKQSNTTKKDSVPIGIYYRNKFLKALFLSNICRGLLTFAIFSIGNLVGNDSSSWVIFLSGIPSLFFISTYSFLILFFAQLKTLNVPNMAGLLKPFFVSMNFLLYLVFGVICGVTISSGNIESFGLETTGIIGIMYLICGAIILHLGIRLAWKVNDFKREPLLQKEKHNKKRKTTLNKILILTIGCGTVFIIRGIYNSTVAFKIVKGYMPWKTGNHKWDIFFMILTELLPSALATFLFRDTHTKKRKININVREDNYNSNSSDEFNPNIKNEDGQENDNPIGEKRILMANLI